MAIIRLDCNLNGGDTVTPNNELFYRIYGDVDGYANPIHTTGTALSDANVTVDNDNVIITGVDGATNATFKIAAVDGAFNEGVLSDAVSGSIIVFQDNFAGAAIDTNKWTVSENVPAYATVTQSDELIYTPLQSAGSGVPWDTSIFGKTSIASSGVIAFKFDFVRDDTVGVHHQFYIGIFESTAWGSSEYCMIQRVAGGSNQLESKVHDGTSPVGASTASGVPSTGSYKIVKRANGDTDFCYWNVDQWTIWHTNISLGATTSDWYAGSFYITETSAPIETSVIDNLYMTTEDFDTLNPV